jgi:Zn finger protein HypA/HybF involved in hydrogenase expression
MAMVMKDEIKIEDLEVCLVCSSEWSMQTPNEKYCDNCKSHILKIEDELYLQQGW